MMMFSRYVALFPELSPVIITQAKPKSVSMGENKSIPKQKHRHSSASTQRNGSQCTRSEPLYTIPHHSQPNNVRSISMVSSTA